VIRGFDASSCQGAIPWDALKAAGIEYVYLKCGNGNDPPDPTFERNAQEAKSHGLIVAPYHFLYPLPHIDPVHAAEAHFAACGGIGSNVGELPAAIDLEWPPREEQAKDSKTIIDTWAKWGVGRLQINLWTVAYAKRYRELQGSPPVLYTYPYFAQCLAPLSTELGDCILWFASNWKAGVVPHDGDMPSNALPGLWQKDVLQTEGARGFFWQHDGNGGILMPNGADADFDVFVGSREQFNRLIGMGPENARTVDPVDIPTSHLPVGGGD
jgi:GH25 family lysozyme M1 (1,4-beta-N-acetylmuramidase)